MNTFPRMMAAVHLTGNGGLDKLEYRTDVPVPEPRSGEVLIQVAACGINNTDINTRIGWYSKSVTGATDDGEASGFAEDVADDAAWTGEALSFPRIQGADACGHIVAVGEGVDPSRIGERVLVRSMQDAPGSDQPYDCWTFGSECDGGFAQFSVARSIETFAVDCDWSDTDLASIPCAYSTAENMLHRAQIGAERVLITGASGGVGSAAVQLAKRRGARVIAVASSAKASEVKSLGADQVVDRNENLIEALGTNSVDAVVDLVAGPKWPDLLEILRPGGKYATAGAIAGPIVELDVRTLYLKDLTLFGSTHQDRKVFENLIAYIERGEIKPLVAKTYPLEDIAHAQADFMAKTHTGKLVLVPPKV